MKIKKSYGETVEIKSGSNKTKWIKVNVTLESDKEIKSEEAILEFGRRLFTLGKKLIKQDIQRITKEEDNE